MKPIGTNNVLINEKNIISNAASVVQYDSVSQWL